MASHGWPCAISATITQLFGTNPASYQPDGHTGMDFALNTGSPVYAVADGTVLHASWARELGWPNPYYINPDFTPNDGIDQSAGIVVVIDHGDFVSISGHLDSEGLNNGDKVRRGQIIGRSGNTGFSSGPHLHFEILPDKWNVHGRFYGRVNPLNYISKTTPAPAPVAVAADQRITGAKVNYRKAPNRGGELITEFAADVVLDFKGYITNGESVESNSVWFVGKHTGGYAWSGGFTNSSTAGLPNLTPTPKPVPVVAKPALAADQRITNSKVNYRKAPNRGGELITEFEADVILDFKGYVTNGEKVQDNGIWFVGKHSGGYVWSGGLVDSSTNGLPDLTPKPAPAPIHVPNPMPAPAPIPAPVYVPPVVVTPAYTFEADLDCITEVIPAGEGNFQRGNFPEEPEGAVIHDLGTHGKDTYESAVNHFKNGPRANPSSAHVVISWDHITQMVAFVDRAFGAGPSGNHMIQVEVDPEINKDTEKGRKVKANVRLFLKELYQKYGYTFKLVEHNQIMPTLCGDDIELSWFADIAYTENTVTTPTPTSNKLIFEEIAKTFEHIATLVRKLS